MNAIIIPNFQLYKMFEKSTKPSSETLELLINISPTSFQSPYFHMISFLVESLRFVESSIKKNEKSNECQKKS